MKLAHIELGKLTASRTNMRGGRKTPEIADILPSIRARGVLVPILVRPSGGTGGCEGPEAEIYEIVAGRRRFEAARRVAEESGAAEPMPCAIIEAGDDAAAIEASIIENFARLDPDEVTRWESFTRLVKEGRMPEDIANTFGLSDLAVRRTLALGNLLPRIRDLYRREQIDATTVRHLTLANKTRQREWLALADDANAHAPTGHALKTWLFNGASIPTSAALFPLDTYQGAIVTDLFGDGGYFSDPDIFWASQNDAIEARRAALLADGWGQVILVPPGDYFHLYDHERRAKRKGGHAYLDISARGDVSIHEGYVSRKEALRLAKGDGDTGRDKPIRPEVSGPMQSYIDLHRHAAARAVLLDHPGVALRLMVAHAIAGSPLWVVTPEPRSTRNDAIAESVESCPAEGSFDTRRRPLLARLGFDNDRPSITARFGEMDRLAPLFLTLLDWPDADVMALIGVVMGETLAAGSDAVEALGLSVPIDMAAVWQLDDAFLDLVRDREVLGHILADIAGPKVAAAHAGDKGKLLKALIRDHISGENGRAKVEHWVPRWMAFPPSAYTARGGVGSVERHQRVLEIAEASIAVDKPERPQEGEVPLAA